jgi:uncharacterized protein YqgC (DUF456 family)
MDITQPLQLAVATIGMVAALILSFIPVLPGPVLVWAVAIIFGISEGFHRVTPVAGIAMTLIMVAGVGSDLWLPMLGVKTGGVTCLGAIGSFIGGAIGTFLIPIPLLGTLIGCIVGALFFELMRYREMRKALQAGQSAAKMFILGYVLEVAASVGIFIVYLVSVATSG